MDDKDVGVDGKDTTKIDKQALKRIIELPLKDFLSVKREPRTFNPDRPGHIIKLIVGLIQDYGALNAQEISEILQMLSVAIKDEKVGAYLVCAKAVGWVIEKRKGSNDLFFAKDLRDAANISRKPELPFKNKGRRRADIIEFWKKNDPLRYAGIIEIRRGSL